MESGRNPQTVENIRNGTWQEKAEALGLTVPSSLGNADAKALLVLWQEKCVTRLRIRNTRVQTYQTIKAWAAAAPNNFSAAQTLAALNALFKDGIVRKEDYESGDRRAGRQHLLQPDTELTLREEYVPTDQTKFATATATAPAFNEMALGVAYNDYPPARRRTCRGTSSWTSPSAAGAVPPCLVGASPVGSTPGP